MAFQLDSNIPLLARPADVMGGIQQGIKTSSMLEQLSQSRAEAPIRKDILNQLLEQRGQEFSAGAIAQEQGTQAFNTQQEQGGKLFQDQQEDRLVAQELLKKKEQKEQLAAQEAAQDKNIKSIANTYSGIKGMVDGGRFNDAADALEANRQVLIQAGATDLQDTDEAIEALRSGDAARIKNIKNLGDQAIQLATDRGLIGAGKDEKFSATTTSLPGGITVQTTSKGRKVVTDAGGNVLRGAEATKAITEAEEAKTQRAIDEVKGKEGAKTGVEIDTAADIKEQESIGTTRGSIQDTINKAAIQSRSTRPAVVAVRTALESIDTGKAAQAKAVLGPFIPGLDTSDEEVMQSQITQFVLDTLNKQTGTKTDFDFKKASEASASLGKTTAANKAILDILIKNLDRTIDEQNQFKQFSKQGGKAEDFKFSDKETEDRLNELRGKLGL